APPWTAATSPAGSACGRGSRWHTSTTCWCRGCDWGPNLPLLTRKVSWSSSDRVVRFAGFDVKDVQTIGAPKPVRPDPARQRVCPRGVWTHDQSPGERDQDRTVHSVVSRQDRREAVRTGLGQRDCSVEQNVVAALATQFVGPQATNEQVIPQSALQNVRSRA